MNVTLAIVLVIIVLQTVTLLAVLTLGNRKPKPQLRIEFGADEKIPKGKKT